MISRPIAWWRAHRSSLSRGQGIVELALVLPVLLLIVMIALDAGRVYLGWVQMNNAARIGANYAALHPDAWPLGLQSQRDDYANQVNNEAKQANCSLPWSPSASPPAVPVPTFPAGKSVGSVAVVSLSCTFRPLTPIIGGLIGSINVTAGSQFPIRGGALFGPPVTPEPGLPLAQFTVNPPAGAAPLAVTFTDFSIGPGITAWLWTFGDGSTSTAAGSTTHTYTTANTFTASLRITNSVGSSTYSTTVVVSTATPTPTATATSTGPTPTGPTPTPTSSPSPTPTATLAQCTVPSFVGTLKANAQGKWTTAGFLNANIFFVPNNGNWTIAAQSLVAGSMVPCSAQVTVYELAPSPTPTVAPTATPSFVPTSSPSPTTAP